MLALASVPGCEGEIAPFLAERIEVINDGRTVTGASHSHHITSVQITSGFAHTVDLAPGESRVFEVVFPGDYSVKVTYDDGTNEGGQQPADPVHVSQAEKVRVWFQHQ